MLIGLSAESGIRNIDLTLITAGFTYLYTNPEVL